MHATILRRPVTTPPELRPAPACPIPAPLFLEPAYVDGQPYSDGEEHAEEADEAF